MKYPWVTPLVLAQFLFACNPFPKTISKTVFTRTSKSVEENAKVNDSVGGWLKSKGMASSGIVAMSAVQHPGETSDLWTSSGTFHGHYEGSAEIKLKIMSEERTKTTTLSVEIPDDGATHDDLVTPAARLGKDLEKAMAVDPVKQPTN